MQGPFGHGIHGRHHNRAMVYKPAQSPGFAAWVTGFDYGDGRMGLSFKETKRAHNPDFVPPRLEMGEAIGAPVSYGAIECGSDQETSYRVYLVSEDDGITFHETGRCLLEEGSFCNIGFPGGRILGYDVPRTNQDRTGWSEGIRIRESMDGGSTWRDLDVMLPGTAPYLWRVRRLRDGTIVLLASLYGTPWGLGKERTTRNTMLPNETYLNKIQTFFMTSADGVSFSGPHYILPGVGAHEYDVVEKADGSLLFIAGDVQATPVARQLVNRQQDRFINGTIFGINRGAPQNPADGPQGGFVPETIVGLPDGLIVGARRGKPYSCSWDDGDNWYEIDELPVSLYQPMMMITPKGRVFNVGHFGGDNAFGEVDMHIAADRFEVKGCPPAPSQLQLVRRLADDQSHYTNRYAARLTVNGKGVGGQGIQFRCAAVWNEDGSVNTKPQVDADVQRTATTDEEGWAFVHFCHLDSIPDIHHYTNVDVVFAGNQREGLSACRGATICSASLTPYRRCLYPHKAYFANGTLFLSPEVMALFPDAPRMLMRLTTADGILQTEGVPDSLLTVLRKAHVLADDADGAKRWYRSIHSEAPLMQVRQMTSGDWYV